MAEVIVALDSFKGSLDARRACAALARGLRRAGHGTVVEFPVADGGEGTVDALVSAGFAAVAVDAVDPLGRPVVARYARRGDEAVVELAAASGLGLLADTAPIPQRALDASTFGTGQVLRAALDAGCTQVSVAVGGSATTDGGSGLLVALGAVLSDRRGARLPGVPSPLRSVHRLDLGPVDLRGVRLIVACDVDNPLLGPAGAAAVYGAQKGADDEAVDRLDHELVRWAQLVEQATTVDVAGRPGAGAAGGAGFALLALGARMRPGIDTVLTLTGLAERLPGAELVITGEGSLDRQTLHGKAPIGVAALAHSAGVPVVAVCGRTGLNTGDLAAAGFARAYALTDIEPDEQRCIAEAETLLEELGKRMRP